MVLKIKTKIIFVHIMFWACNFHELNRNSMNNLLSYCGLIDARISASEKDLPVFLQMDNWIPLINVTHNYETDVGNTLHFETMIFSSRSSKVFFLLLLFLTFNFPVLFPHIGQFIFSQFFFCYLFWFYTFPSCLLFFPTLQYFFFFKSFLLNNFF